MLLRVMNEKTPFSDVKANNLKDWGEVLSAVCKRPRMYVGANTLQNVLDFVGGYLFAQSLLSPEPQVPSSSWQSSKQQPEEWRRFSYWLAQKFGYPRNYAWYAAGEYFATDEEALEAFPVLLKEFRNEGK